MSEAKTHAQSHIQSVLRLNLNADNSYILEVYFSLGKPLMIFFVCGPVYVEPLLLNPAVWLDAYTNEVLR